MTVKVAIVGSRDVDRPDLIEQVLVKLQEEFKSDLMILTGDARGVDREVARQARRMGLHLVVFQANYDLHAGRAPLIRNAALAASCDRMVAIWNLKSAGTRNAIGFAQKHGKPVNVIATKEPPA